MVDVKKLDLVINDLEESSKDILKLGYIIKDTEILIDKNMENSNLLAKLLKDMNDAREKILLSNELCEKSYKAIDNNFIKSAEINEKNISKINTLLFEMKNENANFYLRFESTVNSKLDMFKSDVLVENRKNSEDIISKISKDIGKKYIWMIILMSITAIASTIGVIIQIIK